MAELWPEISEEQAKESGELRTVYEDIQATLRVRFVPWPFRVLAVHGKLFPHLWQEWVPTITHQLEEAADAVREHAVTPLLEAAPGSDHRVRLKGLGFSEDRIAQIQDQLHVYHYLNPKLLLLFVVLEGALAGRPVRVKSIVVWPTGRGAPPFMPRVERIEPTGASGEVAQILQETQQKLGLPTVSDEYRTLAQWPNYLAYAWPEVVKLLETGTYETALQAVDEQAVQAVQELRRRMELRPEDLQRLGISESEREEICQKVAAIRRALPGLVVQTAYLLLAVAGPEEARLSGDALMRRWSSSSRPRRGRG